MGARFPPPALRLVAATGVRPSAARCSLSPRRAHSISALGARTLVDLKNPKDPIHEFMRTHKMHVLKPQMATGAKVYYNGLDGAVR